VVEGVILVDRCWYDCWGGIVFALVIDARETTLGTGCVEAA
jgi:hypothetical protein